MQTNGKIVIFNENPMTISKGSLIPEENLDIIQCLGEINQVNRSVNCKVEAILDLKYLFAGTKISEEKGIVTIEIYKIIKDEERKTEVGFVQNWD